MEKVHGGRLNLILYDSNLYIVPHLHRAEVHDISRDDKRALGGVLNVMVPHSCLTRLA